MPDSSRTPFKGPSNDTPDIGSSFPASQVLQQGSAAVMDREYEFFVTTEEPHQPEGVERGRIRRLVMRNFFETKLADPQKRASENSSAGTIMSQRQLRSRFRLSEMGNGSRVTRCRRKNDKTEARKGKERRSQTKRTNLELTMSSTDAEDDVSKTHNQSGSPLEEGLCRKRNKSDRKVEDKRLVLKINPKSNSFDPFDVLPVPGTLQLDMLFQLCESFDSETP